MFIYSYDKEETERLIQEGLKLISQTEKYTIFQKPKKFKFDLSEFKYIEVSNRMVFMGR